MSSAAVTARFSAARTIRAAGLLAAVGGGAGAGRMSVAPLSLVAFVALLVGWSSAASP